MKAFPAILLDESCGGKQINTAQMPHIGKSALRPLKLTVSSMASLAGRPVNICRVGHTPRGSGQCTAECVMMEQRRFSFSGKIPAARSAVCRESHGSIADVSWTAKEFATGAH
jgi:hypothetical protein